MWLLLMLLQAGPAMVDRPGVVRTEFIFESAPFPSCHASTIVETQSGLVAAWFGGRREKDPSVGVWLARYVNGHWTGPTEVANGNQSDGTRYPCWNPVLFQPKDAPLMLFFKVGPNPSQWWGMLQTSDDAGKTWSEPRRLPDGVLGPIKNKPVQLPDGDVLCGSSTESAGRPGRWRVHFERTNDLGRAWTKVAPETATDGHEIDAIQPSVLVHPNGELQAVGRTRAGRVFQTWSADGGRSWSPLALTTLPNPNSGIDAVTLRDGRQLIVYNHTTKGRTPLNVAVTHDGKEWHSALVLEHEPGEYSYPAVIQTRDGLVHITYTWRRERIAHVVVDPAKLDLK